ncbi:hypothetical protein Pflav_008180 [Phytohabitans flavus]|uniref:Malonyl-CoA:ACP transacylase (MAT) domain-containing protein n=1 Tax=Phytohabitans flavus TaxID=1076124 RepID=A0A6F8XKT9_9ACTN|nr:hypothetical protein Pflav_008180 [Phytohabitans flavus]
MIRQALANARLAPSDVDAVEAHGTGTKLGDPIEAQALLATYGQGRERPLWLGSVKSNIGHTQAAAGVAGVIKMVLAMRHGTLPQTLHVDAPTPEVDWTAGAVSLLTEPVEWSANGHPRRAGVSSFGISGTNAHVIIEEGDAPSPAADVAPQDPQAPVVPWVLSAKSEAALRGQAARLASFASGGAQSPADVGWSLLSRSRMPWRAVVAGRDGAELAAALRDFAAADPAAGVVSGPGTGAGAGVVFVFPGQGSQWAGMAAELLASSPVFAAAFDECATALSSFVDWDPRAVLTDPELLERVEMVQPVLWAVMVSLAEVWQSYGVRPAAVVGHSQGEIAAACVAGALSLEDGARVVALRARAVRKLAGGGAMVSVAAPTERVAELLAGHDGVSIAAVNGPGSVVVAGLTGPVDEFVRYLDEREVRNKRIPVDYAAHSVQVEPIRDELLAMMAAVRPRAARVPWYSTADRRWMDGTQADAEYWYRMTRQAVWFGPAIEALLDGRYHGFVEVSPHPVLTVGIQESIDAAAAPAWVTGTLRRDEGGTQRLYTSLGTAYANGVEVDWHRAFAGIQPRTVDLPTYAFQGNRYWLSPPPAGSGDVTAAGLGSAEHPLLGASVTLADGDGVLLTGRLSVKTHPWLADHAVSGAIFLPGTAFVELAVRAGDEVGANLLDDLTLNAPLVLPENGARQLQITVGAPDHTGNRELAIWSRLEDGDPEWIRHAEGVLATTSEAPESTDDLVAWPRPAPTVSPRRLVRRPRPGRARIRPGVPGPARGVAARQRPLRRGRAPGRRARRRRSLRAAPGSARLRPARRRPRRLERRQPQRASVCLERCPPPRGRSGDPARPALPGRRRSRTDRACRRRDRRTRRRGAVPRPPRDLLRPARRRPRQHRRVDVPLRLGGPRRAGAGHPAPLGTDRRPRPGASRPPRRDSPGPRRRTGCRRPGRARLPGTHSGGGRRRRRAPGHRADARAGSAVAGRRAVRGQPSDRPHQRCRRRTRGAGL